jgi:hypothetical protein
MREYAERIFVVLESSEYDVSFGAAILVGSFHVDDFLAVTNHLKAGEAKTKRICCLCDQVNELMKFSENSLHLLLLISVCVCCVVGEQSNCGSLFCYWYCFLFHLSVNLDSSTPTKLTLRVMSSERFLTLKERMIDDKEMDDYNDRTVALTNPVQSKSFKLKASRGGYRICTLYNLSILLVAVILTAIGLAVGLTVFFVIKENEFGEGLTELSNVRNVVNTRLNDTIYGATRMTQILSALFSIKYVSM